MIKDWLNSPVRESKDFGSWKRLLVGVKKDIEAGLCGLNRSAPRFTWLKTNNAIRFLELIEDFEESAFDEIVPPHKSIRTCRDTELREIRRLIELMEDLQEKLGRRCRPVWKARDTSSLKEKQLETVSLCFKICRMCIAKAKAERKKKKKKKKPQTA